MKDRKICKKERERNAKWTRIRGYEEEIKQQKSKKDIKRTRKKGIMIYNKFIQKKVLKWLLQYGGEKIYKTKESELINE